MIPDWMHNLPTGIKLGAVVFALVAIVVWMRWPGRRR